MPFEPIIGPLEAKRCLLGKSVKSMSNDQRAKGLAHFLKKEAPRALAAVAEILECQNKSSVPGCSLEGASPPLEDECDADDTDVAIEAAKQGATPIMASYQRDLASFLHDLGQAIDPKGDTQLRLEFKQRKRSRPTDQEAKMLHDSQIEMRVRVAELKYPKREAGVAHVAEELGISRGKVFRALKRAK